jgi:hypothetical protein
MRLLIYLEIITGTDYNKRHIKEILFSIIIINELVPFM